MARTGRRPGDTDTGARIAAAAADAFAEHGYDGATIRMIAGRAGVDPSLVHHYFGTKEDLFAASIRLPVAPEELTATVLDEGVEGAGERMAHTFFTIWEQPEPRRALLGILRSALTGEGQGAEAMRRFITAAMVERIAPAIGGPDARLRLELAAGHLVGIAVLRYVMGFEPLRSTPPEELAALVGPRLQSYFTPGC